MLFAKFMDGFLKSPDLGTRAKGQGPRDTGGAGAKAHVSPRRSAFFFAVHIVAPISDRLCSAPSAPSRSVIDATGAPLPSPKAGCGGQGLTRGKQKRPPAGGAAVASFIVK